MFQYLINNEVKQISEEKKKYILLVLPISLIILALIFDDVSNIINGLHKIIIHPDILITDYIAVGGLGATFINSAILTLANIYILHKLKIKINGVSIAAIFTIAGFSFLGKNIFNVWPIYLGGIIYSRYQKHSFKRVALITMFGTSLSPIVSVLVYGFDLPLSVGLILGIIFGVFVGFILPPLSSHMLKVHDGYNLYNTGFTAGFIGTVFIAIFRSFGFAMEKQQILSTQYDTHLKILLFTFFILLITFGYTLNGKSFRGYKDILRYTGGLITDFTQLSGFGVTLINMGIMGIIGMLYVIISGGIINGPIVAGLMTIVGFSSFGKHPKNTIPILLGVLIGSITKVWDINSTVVIISGLFGTTIAPIAGTYGWLIGMLAGFIHLSVVMNIGYLHGGINLYNNGFAGGIVASIMVPIIDAFKRED